MVHNSSLQESPPFTVALTGGIASGKTMASDAFAQLGVPVIDTDVIARDLVRPGQSSLDEIVTAFGPDIIDERGELRRSKLRGIIFSNAHARQKLESILHPKIRQRASEEIANITSEYCILVIPLLAEGRAYPNINRTLVVDTETETQITRLMARDNLSRRQAEQALASQTTRDHRLKFADDILDNSGSQKSLFMEIAKLHQKYARLAKLKSYANMDS